jgi:flagellar motor switch protein FliG
MDPRNLIGSLKAAILVHALGWDVISPVVDQLSKAERNLIFKLQSRLHSVSPALVESVAKEFLEKAAPPRRLRTKTMVKGPNHPVTTSMIDGKTI